MLNQERNWFFENKAVSLSGWLHKAHNRLVFFKLKKEQTLVFFAKSLPSNSTGSPVRLLHLKSSTGNMLMGSRCLQTTRFYFPQGRNSLDRNLATDVSKLYMQLFLLRHRAHICFQLTQTAAFKFYDDKCITKSRSISHQVWTNLNQFLFPPPPTSLTTHLLFHSGFQQHHDTGLYGQSDVPVGSFQVLLQSGAKCRLFCQGVWVKGAFSMSEDRLMLSAFHAQHILIIFLELELNASHQ